MSSQSVTHVQESLTIEGESVSEVIERTASKVFRNTPNLNKFLFSQTIIQCAQWDDIL